MLLKVAKSDPNSVSELKHLQAASTISMCRIVYILNLYESRIMQE